MKPINRPNGEAVSANITKGKVDIVDLLRIE
jgi:hypothetical protein